MLTTLLRPNEGSAFVAGHDVVRDGLAVRQSIGYVPQAISIDGALTAYENLEFYGRATGVPRRERRERIEEAVDAMQLASFLDRLGRTLSGGMLRRLEIATALLKQPVVLFLDEPTVGLDPTARRLVWERLELLREEAGTTVLVTTHQMEEAERQCDRIALMDLGSDRRARLAAASCAAASACPRSRTSSPRSPAAGSRKEGASEMSAQAADVRAGSVEAALRSLPVRAARLRDGTFAMGWAELRKLRHDHLDIFTRSVQPLLWLFIFGTALQHNHALSGGSGDYRAYLAPGVMAQAALFVAIFFGLGVIWERDVGQLQRLLATPLPRLGIVLGKATGAAIRALAQAVVLLVVIAIARISIHWSVQGVVGAIALLLLGTAAFACLSMILASLVRTRERFMGIGQLVVMPLFFASSALYPLAIMPAWLRVVAHANPLSYEVHGMRDLLLGISAGGWLWLDFTVMISFLVVTAVVAAKTYPRAIL